MLDLIRDGKALDKRIASHIKAGKKWHNDAHLLAASALFHAAEHGNPAKLNTFYTGLTEAYRSALKQWVGNLAGELGINGKAGEWIDFAKGVFIVIKGTNEIKADWMTRVLTDPKVENADPLAKSFNKAFYEKDPRQGVNQFGADNIVKQLQTLAKRAHKAAEEDGVAIPDELIALVDNAAKEAATLRPVLH